MTMLSDVRTRLTSLFNTYGNDVTVTTITSSNNSRGDSTETIGSSTSVKAFVRDSSKGKTLTKEVGFNYDGWDIVFPYNTTLEINDKVTINGVNWRVKNHHSGLLQGGVVYVGAILAPDRSL